MIQCMNQKEADSMEYELISRESRSQIDLKADLNVSLY